MILMALTLFLLLVGKKVQWSQSKSLRVPVSPNPGIEVSNLLLCMVLKFTFLSSFDEFNLFINANDFSCKGISFSTF